MYMLLSLLFLVKPNLLVSSIWWQSRWGTTTISTLYDSVGSVDIWLDNRRPCVGLSFVFFIIVQCVYFMYCDFYSVDHSAACHMESNVNDCVCLSTLSSFSLAPRKVALNSVVSTN